MVQTMLRAPTPATDPAVSHFEIHAERCPHLFAKIAGILANRSVMPRNVHMRRSASGMWLAIEAEMTGGAAEQLADKLRGIVAVEAVIHIPAFPAGNVACAKAGHMGAPVVLNPALVG